MKKNGGTLSEAVSGWLEGLETLNSPEGTVPRWRTSTDKSLALIGGRKWGKMAARSQNNNLFPPRLSLMAGKYILSLLNDPNDILLQIRFSI